tara:strand:- start:391 stop:2106 length:1716 start_codon:yes stop_codon:yes gene_type:complete
MNNENIELKKNLDLGIRYIQRKEFNEAIKIYEKILAEHPNNFDANLNLGTIFAQSNNLKKATELWAKAIKINPKIPDAHNNLASIYMRLGEYDKASKHIKEAIRINPKFSLAYNNLGMLKTNTGFLEEGKSNFLKAIELDPKNIMAFYNLANLYQKLNDIENSENFYIKAIGINPMFFEAYNNLMNMYERIGENTKLKDIINKSEKYFIDNSSIKLFKGKLLLKLKEYKDAINNLESIQFDLINKTKEISRCTTLAKCYDQIGDYKKAYKFFNLANENNFIINKDKIDKEKAINIIKERINFFENPIIKEWPIPNSNKMKKNPIFLIGFPRSGTTLLDTVLRSHPSIDVIEEKPTIDIFIKKLKEKTFSNLNNLKFLEDNLLDEMRNVYYESLSKYVKKDDKKICIDKMPLNIIHVGEIVRIFPKAKFILAIRHPCDTVLSCFMQSFVLNDSMANFLNLEDSSNMYNLTMTLWEKYLNVLKINYHTIKYEDVVSNFEVSIKKLLEFLELPWSENVTKFYETAEKRGIISTPSYDQVNKPLYSKSINRWKNYESQFSNILPILKPWIERYGY